MESEGQAACTPVAEGVGSVTRMVADPGNADVEPARLANRLDQPLPCHNPRSLSERVPVQGVIKAYDPATGLGVVVRDTDLAEFDLAADALEGSVFRMLRQGQRVLFDLDEGQATRLRLGSEVDMGTPPFLTAAGDPEPA